MADYNITLTANHQHLTADYLPLAAESIQYLTAQIICETDDWDGREIKAMFGQGCTVHEVSVTDGEITAKQQLNLTAGDWCVWLVGNSARDGEVIPRITTNVAHISVAPTGGTEGNPFPTVPPTVEEQLRADMGNLADLTTKDKSSLVAAINEAAVSGGAADAVTYTPQTLTDEQQAQARTNIGAEKAGTGYTKPAGGIPKADLDQDVQTSLAKADTAISLGLTAATVGQIIKVKAVQDGKPTEWEAVDMPGGGANETWEEIAAGEFIEDVAVLEISADKDGAPFALRKMQIQITGTANRARLNTRVGASDSVYNGVYDYNFFPNKATANNPNIFGEIIYGEKNENDGLTTANFVKLIELNASYTLSVYSTSAAFVRKDEFEAYRYFKAYFSDSNGIFFSGCKYRLLGVRE